MTDAVIYTLCLSFQGLLLLFWLLVRMDQQSRARRLEEKKDSAGLRKTLY